jgi:hypothetical protein
VLADARDQRRFREIGDGGRAEQARPYFA